MHRTDAPNVQSGVPAAVSTDDAATPRPAERRDGHYEDAEDHIVKVVHQVAPESLPNQGPMEYPERKGPQTPTLADVKVTPDAGSVWEAGPGDKAPS